MSEYYKPNRNPDWSYGGKNFKLSRSKLDLFLECPRCFYVDNKLGVARPPGFPFSLNAAVDKLLKKEFDTYRILGEPHPLMAKYKVMAKPLQHKDLEKWRHTFTGVQHLHKPTGLLISGAVDDVWVNDKNELHVVDYKATSKEREVTLDADWQEGYKRQMEVYQWLLRQNGFKVSDTGYFVYVNGKTDREAFDAKLEFDVTLIPYKGSDAWVEGAIRKAHACLMGNIPEAAPNCDYCNYRNAANKVLSKTISAKKASRPEKKESKEPKKDKTLF